MDITQEKDCLSHYSHISGCLWCKNHSENENTSRDKRTEHSWRCALFLDFLILGILGKHNSLKDCY